MTQQARDEWTGWALIAWCFVLTGWSVAKDQEIGRLTCRIAAMETLATNAEPLANCKESKRGRSQDER